MPLYDDMLLHSHQVITIHQGAIACTSRVLPDPEQLIVDAMSIPGYRPTRAADGSAVMGEATYWSREEAERKIDAVLAGLVVPQTEAAA